MSTFLNKVGPIGRSLFVLVVPAAVYLLARLGTWLVLFGGYGQTTEPVKYVMPDFWNLNTTPDAWAVGSVAGLAVAMFAFVLFLGLYLLVDWILYGSSDTIHGSKSTTYIDRGKS